MRIGYACINMTLQQAGGITTNRGMRQKTFNERGLSYVSELALQNIRDLVKSQNLIDVRTPSFLNVKIKLEKRKKNNFFEFNNRLKNIDLIDSFFVQRMNKDFVLIKIRYLGKISKIIKKLEDQNMSLKNVNNEWELSII